MGARSLFIMSISPEMFMDLVRTNCRDNSFQYINRAGSHAPQIGCFTLSTQDSEHGHREYARLAEALIVGGLEVWKKAFEGPYDYSIHFAVNYRVCFKTGDLDLKSALETAAANPEGLIHLSAYSTFGSEDDFVQVRFSLSTETISRVDVFDSSYDGMKVLSQMPLRQGLERFFNTIPKEY